MLKVRDRQRERISRMEKEMSDAASSYISHCTEFCESCPENGNCPIGYEFGTYPCIKIDEYETLLMTLAEADRISEGI